MYAIKVKYNAGNIESKETGSIRYFINKNKCKNSKIKIQPGSIVLYYGQFIIGNCICIDQNKGLIEFYKYDFDTEEKKLTGGTIYLYDTISYLIRIDQSEKHKDSMTIIIEPRYLLPTQNENTIE